MNRQGDMLEPQLTLIGSRFPRLDARRKATGEAKYGADVSLRGALYGTVLRSPLPHARVLHIDATKAEGLPGVKAVLLPEDVPPIRIGMCKRDEPILADGKVRHVGEAVAAVAAMDEDAAEEALSLIRVEYEPLAAVFDPEEALRPEAPWIHEHGNIADYFAFERGDMETGLREAELIVEERFDVSCVQHCFLEPLACVASFDSSGRPSIWSNLKSSFKLRKDVAITLGLPESRVRVILTEVGGEFGGKGQTRIPSVCMVALLARKAGRPVQMAFTREEEFMAGTNRTPAMLSLRVGATREGRLTFKEAKIIADSGAYCKAGPWILTTMAIRPDSMYRLPNLRTEATLAYTNNCPVGQYRGFGNTEGTFALESMMDMVAERLGMDPVDLRLRNAVQVGDTTAHGWEVRSCYLSECLKEVSQRSTRKSTGSSGAGKTGRGTACMIHVSGRKDTGMSRALVRITSDGRAIVISGEGDTGGGAETVFAVIAAEVLGLPLEDIQVLAVDTDVSPECTGLSADKGTTVGGNAVRLASVDAKRKLFNIASERLEANPRDLLLAGGKVFVQGFPERHLTLAEVADVGLSRGQMIIGEGVYDPHSVFEDPLSKYGNVSTSYVFGAQAVEVAVDQDTGQVKVTRVLSAVDLGRAVNPMAAEGQVQGAALQGLGQALTEQLVRRDGMALNPHFVDYGFPTALDVPAIEPILMESNDPFGPFGAKGGGEPASVPTAAAIANAVYDAIGIRVKTMPIWPEDLLPRKAPTGLATRDGSMGARR